MPYFITAVNLKLYLEALFLQTKMDCGGLKPTI